jgi:hypothetical protein
MKLLSQSNNSDYYTLSRSTIPKSTCRIFDWFGAYCDVTGNYLPKLLADSQKHGSAFFIMTLTRDCALVMNF